MSDIRNIQSLDMDVKNASCVYFFHEKLHVELESIKGIQMADTLLSGMEE